MHITVLPSMSLSSEHEIFPTTVMNAKEEEHRMVGSTLEARRENYDLLSVVLEPKLGGVCERDVFPAAAVNEYDI